MLFRSVRESVVYQVKGAYRKGSNGISVFIPSAPEPDAYNQFKDSASASRMRGLYYLYEPLLRGNFSDEAVQFVQDVADFLNSLDAGSEAPVSADRPGHSASPWDASALAQGLHLPSLGRWDASALAAGLNFAETSGMNLDDHPVEYIERDGETYACLNLGAEKAALLSRVTFILALCGEC